MKKTMTIENVALDEVKPYPEAVLKLMTIDGFNDFVLHISAEEDISHIDAYQLAEAAFHKLYGKRRYEDYQSWKVSYSQVRNRRQELKRMQRLPMFPEY